MEYTEERIEEMHRLAKERSEEISKSLYEFNRMLQKREKSREECYMYLFERQAQIEDKYGVSCRFSFLYPEWVFKVPDTYEEYKEQMNEFKSDLEDISKLQK